MRKPLENLPEPAGFTWPDGLSRTTDGTELDPERNAVITASSGIGKAIATAIASTGAAVCLAGRDAKRLEVVARKVRATARSVLVCESDLTIDAAIDKLARRLKDEFAQARSRRERLRRRPSNSSMLYTGLTCVCRLC